MHSLFKAGHISYLNKDPHPAVVRVCALGFELADIKVYGFIKTQNYDTITHGEACATGATREAKSRSRACYSAAFTDSEETEDSGDDFSSEDSDGEDGALVPISNENSMLSFTS